MESATKQILSSMDRPDAKYVYHTRLRRDIGRYLLIYVLALGGALAFLVPFAFMMSTSLKNKDELLHWPPNWFPAPLVWNNYIEPFRVVPFGLYYRNSAIITALSLIGSLASGAIVSFAFARLRWRGRDAMFMLILATMMIPGQVTLIPTYIIFARIGWVNTWLPLVVPSFFGGGAWNIFLLRQYMRTIPYELEEAAVVDGASVLQRFWNIVLPLTGPAMATLAIFGFIGSWNDFMGPLLYLRDIEKMTVQVGLARFRNVDLMRVGGMRYESGVNYLMAMSTMAILPILIVFIVAQKYFVEGIQLTGLKG